MRITVVNAAYDPADAVPRQLLDRFTTLTEWCEAMQAAGAHVEVAQRFPRPATLERAGVTVHVVNDAQPAVLPPFQSPSELVATVVRTRPDVVHVNGMMFPELVRQIRRELGARARIVIQDHAGVDQPGRYRTWAEGLAAADAFSFTSLEQAVPWRDAGLIQERQTILAIREASTRIQPTPRPEARAVTGLSGAPLLLWVGRLNANKDPLAALAGVEMAMAQLSEARLAMVYSGEMLLPDVRARIDSSPVLSGRVTLVGPTLRNRMPHYYGSADIFVSASHREGSGYALIEALACGLVPVVTDIPAFRAIAGPCGERWRVGDAGDLARCLGLVAARDQSRESAEARRWFEANLSWSVIAEQTLSAYAALTPQDREASG